MHAYAIKRVILAKATTFDQDVQWVSKQEYYTNLTKTKITYKHHTEIFKKRIFQAWDTEIDCYDECACTRNT